LKKFRRRADDYGTEEGTNVTVLKWYDNHPVYLVSPYEGRHPVEIEKYGRETNYEEKEPVEMQ
jgi:hypothetical protein